MTTLKLSVAGLKDRSLTDRGGGRPCQDAAINNYWCFFITIRYRRAAGADGRRAAEGLRNRAAPKGLSLHGRSFKYSHGPIHEPQFKTCCSTSRHTGRAPGRAQVDLYRWEEPVLVQELSHTFRSSSNEHQPASARPMNS